MSAARRLASRLLTAAARAASAGRQEWADAMRRELDSIESDRAALLWALGGAAALLRDAAPRLWRTVRMSTAGIVSGMAYAAVVVFVCAAGLTRLVPGSDPHQPPIAEYTVGVGLPGAVFLITALAIWGRRKPAAAGMLLAGTTLIAHVIAHASAQG